jgi:hypothetical protein
MPPCQPPRHLPPPLCPLPWRLARLCLHAHHCGARLRLARCHARESERERRKREKRMEIMTPMRLARCCARERERERGGRERRGWRLWRPPVALGPASATAAASPLFPRRHRAREREIGERERRGEIMMHVVTLTCGAHICPTLT